jgi:hypothetical protein
LLAIVIAPVAAPAVVGAKVACNAMDCPAAIVTGTATPLTLYSPPLTPTRVICTSLCPEFFNVTACEAFPFTSTFPKLSVVVLKESCDVVAFAPLSFTCDEPPFEVIAMSVPDADPDFGAVYTT